MAIEQGAETISVTTQERTWRLEIFTEKGADPTVRAHREIVKADSAGNVLSRERGVTVDRALSQVATQAFAIGGKSYTGGEIAGVLAAIADTWREEDIAAAAEAAPLQAPQETTA